MDVRGGAQPIDANSQAVRIATAIDTGDGGTLDSVVTLTTTPTEFEIPENALKLRIMATDGSIRVGDNSTLDGTAGNGYVRILLNKEFQMACVNGTSLWARSVTGSVVTGFIFEDISA